jgi:hypothetical protein
MRLSKGGHGSKTNSCLIFFILPDFPLCLLNFKSDGYAGFFYPDFLLVKLILNSNRKLNYCDWVFLLLSLNGDVQSTSWPAFMKKVF